VASPKRLSASRRLAASRAAFGRLTASSFWPRLPSPDAGLTLNSLRPATVRGPWQCFLSGRAALGVASHLARAASAASGGALLRSPWPARSSGKGSRRRCQAVQNPGDSLRRSRCLITSPSGNQRKMRASAVDTRNRWQLTHVRDYDNSGAPARCGKTTNGPGDLGAGDAGGALPACTMRPALERPRDIVACLINLQPARAAVHR